jgi:hypothetical protein
MRLVAQEEIVLMDMWNIACGSCEVIEIVIW